MELATNIFHKEQIVYEDNHILVANKLAGQIVQGDKTGDAPLSELIKEFIKKRDNKPGNVFCGVIHRIDRPVSGLVIFAKTSKALSRFNELVRDRKIQKSYLAVVKNKPATEKGTLKHWLIKNEKTNTSKAYANPVNNALESVLEYKYLGSSSTYHLLKINLITGRHHQIRCQLGSIGSSIKGDLKYGAERSNQGGFIHLHSAELSFAHPIKNEPIHLFCYPISQDPVWNYFKVNIKP